MYDSRGNLASFCQVSFTYKWRITARMWSILKPANKQGWWNQMGKFHRKQSQKEGQGRSVCGCIFCGKGHRLPDWGWAENNKMEQAQLGQSEREKQLSWQNQDLLKWNSKITGYHKRRRAVEMTWGRGSSGGIKEKINFRLAQEQEWSGGTKDKSTS